MPCDTIRIDERIDARPRPEQIADALSRLEAALALGTAKAVINRVTGAVAFAGEGWTARDRLGVGDVCAYRRLTNAGSAQLRKALARAEVTAGRPVNRQAVTSGLHSHDGGATWGKG
jgi:hypothetical protein